MRALLAVSNAIDTLIDWIGKLLPWLVTVMIAVGFLNVLLRYIGRGFQLRLTSNAVIETRS